MNIEDYGFKKLTADDRTLFQDFYDKMNNNWASSICFASMIAWNSSITVYHRIIGDYICCIAYDMPYSRWVLLPMIGRYDMESLETSMKAVIKIMEELKLPIVFTDVSDWMLPYYLNLKSVRLKESYDTSLSDYIYTVDDFLKGFERTDNRYNYNYFIKKFNPSMYDIKSSELESYIEYLKANWCKTHTCNECQYGCALDTAANLIGEIEKTGAKGIAVYVDNKMAGYMIVSMERDQLVFHFKKSIHGMRGLNEYMHCRCFALYGDGAKTINYTEDMNIEGLRRYKQRLALSYRLNHKYELSQQADTNPL